MREKRASGREAQALNGLYRYTDILIKAALAEDVGRGDITTEAIIGPRDKGSAVFLAKEDFILAGLFVAERVFKRLDRSSSFRARFRDGGRVRKGDIIARVSGRLGGILTGERVALNFLQRLSGIATITNEFVERTKSTGVKILDTRKTTPLLRPLEKYAVLSGGGRNHRMGLFDSILIKDNHIMAAGGVREALSRVNKRYRGRVRVEVEAKDLNEVREALEGGAQIIMLDNMDPRMIRKAVKLINKRALVEVSGGVNIKTVGRLAKTGVDSISAGALTHSARAVDISMEVVSLCTQTRPKRSR